MLCIYYDSKKSIYVLPNLLEISINNLRLGCHSVLLLNFLENLSV